MKVRDNLQITRLILVIDKYSANETYLFEITLYIHEMSFEKLIYQKIMSLSQDDIFFVLDQIDQNQQINQFLSNTERELCICYRQPLTEFP